MLKTARRLPLIVAGALLLAPVAGAPAQEGYSLDDFTLDTAQDLLDVCTLEEGHPHYWEAKAFCYGYFHGGADYQRALASGPQHKPIVCPPEGTTIREAVAVFVDYARTHAEYLDEAPMDVVFRAVTAEWPCS
jgi:hypothetical protein